MNASPKQEPSRRGLPGIAWLCMAVVAIAAMLLVFALRACSDTEATGRNVKSALKKIPEVAAKFKTGTITHTFIEEIPQIAPTHGDVLEVATSRSEETFTREDSKNILWDMIPLGTTVSEIRAPVTFRYHIRLSDPWRLAAKDKVCMVLAPPIRPSQPPAIHTEGMQKTTESGWARFNKDENLETLEQSITPELEQFSYEPTIKLGTSPPK